MKRKTGSTRTPPRIAVRMNSGTVKLSRIRPFCGRILLDNRLRLNDLAVAAGGENAAKLLNLTVPSRIKSQCTNPALDSRLWSATPVVIPPSWRRTGKRASLTGGLAPTPATPGSGCSNRSIPPMGPSETTRTDPDTSAPRPWVEIVSVSRGSISLRTVRAPSSVISRPPVMSTTDAAAIGLPSVS